MEKYFDLFYECNQIVSTDSRNIPKGCLYIALKGERFDGNKFALEAIEKGAKYAIVDDSSFENGKTIFHVTNGLAFLQNLANYHRRKFKIPFIGITGSNGKTTTKELIASVLKQHFNIHFTEGNLNNHIGVPLTLLKVNNDHDIAIIEMGANKPSDIDELCEIAEPTHGIITNIGAAHLEGFGGLEGVVKTKTALYRSIEKVGGTLFCNFNDDLLKNQLPNNIETIFYGESTAIDVSGKLTKLTPYVNFKWKNENYSSDEMLTQIIGKYNFYNILAAICIGNYFEVPAEKINNGITSYAPKNNRSEISKTLHNTLIMDAYNANPTSVRLALESFSEIEHNNKLFIIGDMFELGVESSKYHREIIDLAKSLNLQGVFVGANFYKHQEDFDSFMFFKETNDVINFFSVAHPKDNLVLVKGSRGMKLEGVKSVF